MNNPEQDIISLQAGTASDSQEIPINLRSTPITKIIGVREGSLEVVVNNSSLFVILPDTICPVIQKAILHPNSRISQKERLELTSRLINAEVHRSIIDALEQFLNPFSEIET